MVFLNCQNDLLHSPGSNHWLPVWNDREESDAEKVGHVIVCEEAAVTSVCDLFEASFCLLNRIEFFIGLFYLTSRICNLFFFLKTEKQIDISQEGARIVPQILDRT